MSETRTIQIVRIYELSKRWNIPSVYIVRLMNNLKSHKVHSASSWVENDCPVFMSILHERVIAAYLADRPKVFI